MQPSSKRGLSRRRFVKAAVAIGGLNALTACLEREESEVPRGPTDRSVLPEGQHVWNEFLDTDEQGNSVAPRHHVLLSLQYVNDGPPSDADRAALDGSLNRLDHAYRRGNDGLLYTLGYSPAYFERFESSLHPAVGLPEPKALSSFEDPIFDRPDALLHLASDRGSVVLATEAALLGERDTLNGFEMDRSMADVFERTDRRTGFVGTGLPAEHHDVDGIPNEESVTEDAPLYMGFKSGFEKSQASERRVTIVDGPFAGGTTQHVSKIRLQLEDWYGEQDHETRVAEMFCPFHAEDGVVEGTGENLGDSNRIEDCRDDIDDAASEYGRIGHAQKVSSVREDGSPLILRRDFDSTDGGEAGVHFVSHQRAIAEFEKTREAMNGTAQNQDPTNQISRRRYNGILEYTFVKRRGNFLVPPRSLRAFPTPTPGE